MKFSNNHFGEFEYEEKFILNFTAGLIGFEENKKYLIVNDEDVQPFRWLVSIEDDSLSFPILDPELLVPGYSRNIKASSDTTVFVVAALNEQADKSTVNLRSPLLIDNTTGEAKQVILDDESLPLQYSLLSSEQSAAKG
jgi:flagellar assembly factor FliW